MRKLAKRIPALILVLLLLFGGAVIAYADGPWDHNPDLTGAEDFVFNTVISGSLDRQKEDQWGNPYHYKAYKLQAPESGYYRFSSTGGHWNGEDDDYYLHVDFFDANGSYLFADCNYGSAAVFGDFLFSFYLEKDETCFMLVFAKQPGEFTVFAEPFDAVVSLKSHSIMLGYKQVLNVEEVLEGTEYADGGCNGYGVSGASSIYWFYSRYSQSSIIYGAVRGTSMLRLCMDDSAFAEVEVTVSYSSWDVFCYKYLFGWLWMNWKKPLTNPIDLFILYTK